MALGWTLVAPSFVVCTWLIRSSAFLPYRHGSLWLAQDWSVLCLYSAPTALSLVDISKFKKSFPGFRTFLGFLSFLIQIWKVKKPWSITLLQIQLIIWSSGTFLVTTLVVCVNIVKIQSQPFQKRGSNFLTFILFGVLATFLGFLGLWQPQKVKLQLADGISSVCWELATRLCRGSLHQENGRLVFPHLSRLWGDRKTRKTRRHHVSPRQCTFLLEMKRVFQRCSASLRRQIFISQRHCFGLHDVLFSHLQSFQGVVEGTRSIKIYIHSKQTLVLLYVQHLHDLAHQWHWYYYNQYCYIYISK